ncbi:MAG: cell division ATPase MinD [Candidatus Norongarragalinales archaeon]
MFFGVPSIVFASGKGGVGKTSIAVNLGVLLAKLGKRVVVVDADVDMAAVSIMLGIEINPITLQNVLAGENTITDAVYEGPHGLYYVPSSLHEEAREIDLTRLRDAVSKLELSYEFVLVDSPPGLSAEARAAIASSQQLIIVSTPDPAALIDSLKIRKFAERSGVTVLGVVLNRVTGDKNELKPQELTAVLGLPLVATLPEDVEVRRSASMQQPVEVRAPHSAFCRGLRFLASALTHEVVPDAKPARASFFERVGAFFKRLFAAR